jgi:hypothetical protein
MAHNPCCQAEMSGCDKGIRSRSREPPIYDQGFRYIDSPRRHIVVTGSLTSSEISDQSPSRRVNSDNVAA